MTTLWPESPDSEVSADPKADSTNGSALVDQKDLQASDLKIDLRPVTGTPHTAFSIGLVLFPFSIS